MTVKPNIGKRSALHEQHLALGATMVEDGGWWRPVRYGAPEEEVQSIRTGVGLLDASPLSKLDVKGQEIAATVQQVLSLGTPLRVGLAQRIPRSDTTAFATDGLCCPLARDHAVLITASGTAQTVERLFEAHVQKSCVHVTDLTSALAAIHLMGPASAELLSKVSALELSPRAFDDLMCTEGSVAKVHALALRRDVGGKLGYEIYCDRSLGEYMWDTLNDAGQEFGVIPIGLAAERLLASAEE